MDFLVTCAEGLQRPLLTELEHLGINWRQQDKDIYVHGLGDMYRVCLLSKVASRVLLPLAQIANKGQDIPQALYDLGAAVAWENHFEAQSSFAIRVSLSPEVKAHQGFAMLRLKDAVVDYFYARAQTRPSIDKHTPDAHLLASVTKSHIRLALDVSGQSLHKRGIKTHATDAPLKENTAAALLYAMGAHQGFDGLCDPMCGSGTFLLEALGILTHMPNMARFGFGRLVWHDETLFNQKIQDASTDFDARLKTLYASSPVLIALDADPNAVLAATKNLKQSPFGDLPITLAQSELAHLDQDIAQDIFQDPSKHVLVVTNPPYGERLGQAHLLRAMHEGLNAKLSLAKARIFLGILVMDIALADIMSIVDPGTLRTKNGDLTVYFRYGQFAAKHRIDEGLITQYQPTKKTIEGAQDFINRLQKNTQHLGKWARRMGVTNLRVYDADLPEFNVAIDLYGRYVHVSEYQAPAQIDPKIAKGRFNLALGAIREVFDIPRERVFIKTRARQGGRDQYQKKDTKTSTLHVVQESGALFYVNLTDYLDTGLFLDHRPMRERLAQEAIGKHVLNLFAYTCSASVHMAKAGAASVTSVDLSQNYLNWGAQNFALNGFVLDGRFDFATGDAFEWLKQNTQMFDLIFIDPPTFSNSKKFQGTFDIQRDHGALIKRAMNRLNPDGALYFSNNFSKFTLDKDLRSRFFVEEITHKTQGRDFARDSLHRSYLITHKPPQERKPLDNKGNASSAQVQKSAKTRSYTLPTFTKINQPSAVPGKQKCAPKRHQQTPKRAPKRYVVTQVDGKNTLK